MVYTCLIEFVDVFIGFICRQQLEVVYTDLFKHIERMFVCFMNDEIYKFEDVDKCGITEETLAVFLHNSHLVLIYFTK